MPELPEAEVVRRQLHAAVVGATINHIRVGRADIIRQGVESLSWYSGSRITEVQRHGKSVVLVCERGAEKRVVVAELGMTGLLLFAREAIPSAEHVHVMMSLVNGPQPKLWYWNARRFGRLYLLDQKDWKAYRQRRFGSDPFTMTGDEFMDLIKSCRGRIKAVLLNQHRIAGIGNIYANEVLFRAGIHPYARGCRLSRKRIRVLFETIKLVLEEAILMGGSSIRSFVAPDGTPGQFQSRHLVYQKRGAPCPNGCGTHIQGLMDERSSFVCSTCQKR
ncbi:MAG: bifunctional DNA-formamidopyrimidine glycosylase/DNA-(apurinic or apyrimidinic site) lyase [Nitrospira sp.]|nr:bifunctional DNA-formamidopyrimidine glycosylase/DNA-(apurinic or apyrimidinic site) lyase [Nitrospira sp.]